MRKILFVLSFVFITFYSNAQVWIDSGAVWHYDYSNIGYGGFMKYTYEKDTLILDHLCQKITHSTFNFYFDIQGILHYMGETINAPKYTYVSGDTVFYYQNNQFCVLYNFGASIGDSWVISTINPIGYCNDTSKVEVRDTGSMIINGTSYRYITLQPTPNSSVGLDGTFVERFGCIRNNSGSIQSLFPTGYQCDSLPFIVEFSWYAFRCFEDQSFPLYNAVGDDCEELFEHVGIPEQANNGVTCFPNPTEGIINFQDTIHENYDLDLYTIQGSLIQRFKITSNNSSIDISNLPNGVYLLIAKPNQKTSFVQKIVKI